MKGAALGVCAGLLLQFALATAFRDAGWDGHDLSGYARARRGWSMMRLGRGLQMLRLGKRMAPPPPSGGPQASPAKMRELLGQLLDDGLEDVYRRGPAPGYSRQMEEDALEELYNALEEAAESDLRPYSPFYPARFKRSAYDHLNTMREVTSNSDQSERSFLPASSSSSSSIGRYLGHVFKTSPSKSGPVLRVRHQKGDDDDDRVTDVIEQNDMMPETSSEGKV